MVGVTKLHIVLTEVIHSVEASVEDLSSSLECVESNIERIPSAEHHQVPHLSTVRPYLLCQVVRAVIDSEAVKGTAGTKT